MNIVVIVILLYFFLIFVVFRLIVPNMGFTRSALPSVLPKYIENEIADLNRNASDDLDYVKRAYEYVTTTYYGRRVETILLFWYAFEDISAYKPGYLPCTSLSHILRILLVKSGRFSEEDVKIHVVPVIFFPINISL